MAVGTHKVVELLRLLRGMPEPHLILDPQLTIVDASDAYLSATLTRREAIIGRHMFDVFPDNPENQQATGAANLRASLHSVLKERRQHVMAVQRYDLVIRSMAVAHTEPVESGTRFETRYWSPVNTPVLGEDGEVEWIIHRVQDVTDFIRLKQAEEEKSVIVQDRMQQIEAEVYRSAQEVRAARDEARRASAAKTDFLAAVSHDLRQPVQAETLFIEVLRRMTLPDAARSAVDRIAASVESLTQMLDELLDLARLDAGIVRPSIKAFRIDRLIADLEEEFRPQAEIRGLALVTAVPMLGCRSDPVLMNQILRNLIGNALKYTPAGAVAITGERRGGQVAITVADTGIGIDDSMIGSIFEDFFQVANPNRDRSRGLGVGLGTVRRLAELLGHEVSVWSKVGRGSEFTIFLPWAEADVIDELREKPPAGETSLALRSVAGRRVLLIEDEAPVATAMAHIMADWGVELTSAQSVSEVEAMLPTMERPDIILSDFRLPEGRTGAEAIEAVHRRWRVPAIIVTGETAEHRLRKARDLGYPLLHKPVSSTELVQALARQL
ncbi:MAG: ATP-binding protein [Pseudomonadota bacterium]